MLNWIAPYLTVKIGGIRLVVYLIYFAIFNFTNKFATPLTENHNNSDISNTFMYQKPGFQ